MALSEIAQRRVGSLIGFGLRRRTEATYPTQSAPEIQEKGKGYVIIPRAFDPASPTVFLGSITEGLATKAIGVNFDNPNLMDFVAWDPKKIHLVTETFHHSVNPHAKSDATIRKNRLQDAGYRHTEIKTYPDSVILIASKIATTNSSPAA